jgi:CcmD family protein
MNFLLEPGVAIYIAVAAALAVWLAIFLYLWRLDRRVQELRRAMREQPEPTQPAPRATLESRATQPHDSAA